MSKVEKFHGIFPAFYACYDDNGDVSPSRIQAYTQFLIDKGIKGLYVNGSSGECMYMTKEERMTVLENVMAVAKGKITVIAHVAAMSTRESVDLAKHAQICGADALAALPPYYFKLPDFAVEQYWRAISEAAELPFIIYNIPETTQFVLSMDLFNKMLTYDKVIGIKNSSAPVQDIQRFKAAGGDNFVVFNGTDEQFIAGRIIGADSGIGGTYGIMPELFLAADAALNDGEVAIAREIQDSINEIIFKMAECRGSLYSVAKEILRLQGMEIGQARLPLPPCEKEDFPYIKKCYEMIEKAKERFCR